MKFTLSWLAEHLQWEGELEALSCRLTSLGLEVEDIHDPAAQLQGLVVGEIVACEAHPNADRLRLCQVDYGGDVKAQVICGAPNARLGLKGVFAPVGQYIPGIDSILKKSKIRGVVSEGMLCSERELQISDEHEGIIELDADAVYGASAAEYLGLDDVTIEVALTPNRGDCASVYGIARDLAASGFGTLKSHPVPAYRTISGAQPVAIISEFTTETQHLCPIFAGVYLRGVSNGASPEWLQKRLRAVGLRPLSALVDISNYVCLGRGRPLHIFDADKLQGDVIVRQAGDGEKFIALNGQEYDVPAGAVVIADERGVISLAGIMGGIETGVDENTRNIFVESALFSPQIIAETGRKLQLESDARYRFERGVDPEYVVPGLAEAVSLIQELCGGEAYEIAKIGSTSSLTRPPISLPMTMVLRKGGLEIDSAQQIKLLQALGCQVKDMTQENATLLVTPPSWRSDIAIAEDLVEEVLRLVGYDHIPATPLPSLNISDQPVLTALQKLRLVGRRLLAGRGLQEIVSWSFLAHQQAEIFGGQDESLRLLNPIASHLDTMRPNLIANLVELAQENLARGLEDPAFYEIGPVFSTSGQNWQVGLLRTGYNQTRHWCKERRSYDLYDIKADIFALFSAYQVPANNLRITTDTPPYYHPQKSGAVYLGKNLLAYFGALHPRILQNFKMPLVLVAGEVMLDAIPGGKTHRGSLRPEWHVSPLQPVKRDLAFLLDKNIPAEDLLRALRGAGRDWLQDIRIFDVFTGGDIPENQRSIACELIIQQDQKTLTDKEIDQICQDLISAAQKKTGALLRQ